MKHAHLAACLVAAAFCLLLSAPVVWGQETEAVEGGGSGIETGTPVPDPSVPAPAAPQAQPGESDPVYSRDREPIRLELRDHRVRIDRLEEARKGFRAAVTPRRRGRVVVRVVQAPTLNRLVTALQAQGFVTQPDLAPLRAALAQFHRELESERAARQAADEGIQKEVSRLSRLMEAWIAKNLPLVIFLGGLAFGLVVAIFGTVALVGVAYRS